MNDREPSETLFTIDVTMLETELISVTSEPTKRLS